MNAKLPCVLVLGILIVSLFPFVASNETSEPLSASVQAIPEYDGGYGYDADTMTMYDHNGFAYSYLPDGIIRLSLPWGYTTFFSFGLTGSYLGVPQKVSALDYTWAWGAEAIERFNETDISQGYDYTFTATNSETLAWSIELAFSCVVGEHMKITHTVKNNYPNALTGVEFWYLFDLTHTPEPCVTTTLGTYYPPLYSALPDSVTWLRLSNQFQFDWRDADYPNGHAYLGDGSMLGVDVDILGVSLVLGDILPGGSRVIDPYFSGVTRTWNAGAASYSGIAASWSPVGVPATGDNITFDGTSVFNCNWNTSVTLGDVSVTTGYTGIVLWQVSHGAHNYYIGSGTVNCQSYEMRIEGNWTKVVGSTLLISTSTINFTGENCYFTPHNLVTYSKIHIHHNLTLLGNGYLSVECKLFENAHLEVGIYYLDMTPSALKGYGIITSTSTGRIGFNINGGVVNCPDITLLCDIRFGTVQASPKTTVLSHDISTTKNVSISGISSVNTGTLNADGFNIFVGGNFGVEWHGITQSLNHVTVYGTWSTSVGTFNPGTSTVTLSGIGRTVTTGAGQSFYDLIVSGTYTTASSVNVTHDLTVSGGLTIGAGKTLTWESDGEYSNTGTITGTGTLELSPTVDYSLTLGTVECPLLIGGSNLTELASNTMIENDVTVTGTLIDETHMTTFTDDCTLDFSTDSYLYNVTVQSGVTVTFADDILATRVVNSGTYSGGAFIEPLPEFTTTPDENAYVGSVWLYTWEQTYWDTFAVESMPGWMIYESDTHTFKAMPNATGFFEFSVSLTWENMTTYQNITILVGPEEPYMSFDFMICFVILLILLTLSIIALGVPRLRIIGLFVVFGVAIMAIPIIIAFGDYYWIAVIFLLASLVISIQGARSSAKGE